MSFESTIKTPIIPDTPVIVSESGNKTLDYKAIAIWSAIGFFLDQDTFFKSEKVLKPASIYNFNKQPVFHETYFKWHYTPKDIGIKQATEEFAHLFEQIIRKQTAELKIILPLSGGLDSRTLAAALKGSQNVNSYSYEFPGGIPENKYGKLIASVEAFQFKSFSIPNGYLWNYIERLADINKCHAEFTNPRQMAFIDDYESLGDIFLLGHWGDVLFDNMNLSNELTFDQQVEFLIKKLVKKGGQDLGNTLWNNWSLQGTFEDHLYDQIATLLRNINIDNVNARLRAFKSMYWAPRWTSTNLQVFSSIRRIAVPYYDNNMCRLICTLPEHLLTGRKIQIEYLKLKAPELASLPWQNHRPFNLYNYHKNRMPWNIPYKLLNKSRNFANKLTGKSFIQRNWELQFTGKQNDAELRHWIFENQSFDQLVPKNTRKHFYDEFINDDQIFNSHPLSMLLTLSVFCKMQL